MITKDLMEKLREEFLKSTEDLREYRSQFPPVEEILKRMKEIQNSVLESPELHRKLQVWQDKHPNAKAKGINKARTRLARELCGSNEEYQKLEDLLRKMHEEGNPEEISLEVFGSFSGFSERNPSNPFLKQALKDVRTDILKYLETGVFIDDPDEIYDEYDSEYEWNAFSLRKMRDYGQYHLCKNTEDAIEQFLNNPVTILCNGLIHEAVDWPCDDILSEQYKQYKQVFSDSYMRRLFPEFKSSDNYDLDNYFMDSEDFSNLIVSSVYEISRKQILEHLDKNPCAKEYLSQKREEQKLLEQIEAGFPENYADLFIQARDMQRHFVIHCGPTNSGKTHDAVEALSKSENGLYLGPLRLLAFEVYEDLKEKGIPVSLITGEEEIIDPEGRITCSTCEAANLDKIYDVAVIDEAQMIGDRFRGGAWTNAILGLQAKNIHVCCAPQALALICSLIELCQDTREILYHERKTELLPDYSADLSDVQKGDAFIVFSRRKVHALGAELMQKGYSVSIIYGSLPYTVRQNEAERFRTGKTDVLVATDAIGMGLNLPIRRILFAETQKYDGSVTRALKDEEYRQIAGRAGRYGIHDTGYYSAGSANKTERCRKAIEDAAPRELEKAVIQFPEPLQEIPLKVSQALKYWQKSELLPAYEKQDISEVLEKAEYLETITSTRSLIWKLTSITFDTKDVYLKAIWESLCRDVVKRVPIDIGKNIRFWNLLESGDLADLELAFKLLDLYYQFCRLAGQSEMARIQNLKNQVSSRICQWLEDHPLQQKKCKYCGKPLSWKHPYGMCQSCHDERYPRYYDYDEYW